MVADQPVAHPHDAVAGLADLRVVGDQEEGLAVLSVELAEEREDLGRPLGVQVAGRLVGEDERRAVDERTGDRHPLLLAARQLGRPVVGAVGEADEGECLERGRLAGAPRMPA